MVGVKQSLGVVPHDQTPDVFGLLAYVGPLARTVADAPEVDGLVRVHDPEHTLSTGAMPEVQITAAEGYDLVAERWRGHRGEIDLVFSTAIGIVMVEVKASKDFTSALQHLTPTKIARLYATAEEYVGTLPGGTLTDVRFDVALVDQMGRLDIHENAFAA